MNSTIQKRCFQMVCLFLFFVVFVVVVALSAGRSGPLLSTSPHVADQKAANREVKKKNHREKKRKQERIVGQERKVKNTLSGGIFLFFLHYFFNAGF